MELRRLGEKVLGLEPDDNGAWPFPIFLPGAHWEDGFLLIGIGVMRDGGWNCRWRAEVGGV